MTENKLYTASIIIIGNEILTGRTQDSNTMWIAERLNERGIVLSEVRVIPDAESKIIGSVNDLRAACDYIFTTGGIGPTHDDITAASVAKAFGVEFVRNDEAYDMLLKHYGEENLTDARAKMAMIPKGARLIPNPVSAAPGFVIDNVYVMAGVPRIMHAMLDNILLELRGGDPFFSNTVTCELPESVLSADLEALEAVYHAVSIGSYPHFRSGSFGLSVVLRSQDDKALKAASEALIALIRKHGEEPRALSVQVPIDF